MSQFLLTKRAGGVITLPAIVWCYNGLLQPLHLLLKSILFHCADHFICVSIRVYNDGFGLGRCHISKAFNVGFILFLYYSVSYFSFLISKVASVFWHDFIIGIYGFFWIFLPFRIENIRLCESKCCYLILFCSGIGLCSVVCLSSVSRTWSA